VDQAKLDKIVHDIIKYDQDSPEFLNAVEELNAIPDDNIRRMATDAIFDYRDEIKPQH
jgi:hypothetical protein